MILMTMISRHVCLTFYPIHRPSCLVRIRLTDDPIRLYFYFNLSVCLFGQSPLPRLRAWRSIRPSSPARSRPTIRPVRTSNPCALCFHRSRLFVPPMRTDVVRSTVRLSVGAIHSVRPLFVFFRPSCLSDCLFVLSNDKYVRSCVPLIRSSMRRFRSSVRRGQSSVACAWSAASSTCQSGSSACISVLPPT